MSTDLRTEDVPELVPARMLNEFTYCPRLFFLEWVQGRFEDNQETAEGRYHHRRVDRPTGRAPLPGEPDELHAARSLPLSSERLGLIAVIDLLEADGEAVVPLDVKRGRPAPTPERAWEPERVQLCAQGLLLREAGYTCDHGVLYFVTTRTRVTVPFDEALVRRTLELLEGLRATAMRDQAPDPLVDSPKCPRCSLVGLCLPDETNLLRERSARPPRRLTPRESAARPLYVSEQGASVGFAKGRVEVRKGDEQLGSVRLFDVSQVCVIGNAQVSTQAMRKFFDVEIPVCWFTYGGRFVGMAEGLPSKHVDLRRRQVALGSHGGVSIARRIVEGKIRNQRTLLRRNAREDVAPAVASLKELAVKASTAESSATLLGLEGAAARLYFQHLPAMLTPSSRLPGSTFTFEGRNRRPPRDAVNCLLSYVYALLVKDLTATTWSVGFDPYMGFYHRPRYGRPALALDLAEEFRPLVADSVVIGAINNGEVRSSHFLVRAGGVALTPDGRRSITRAYERRLDTEVRHPIFGYTITYRRVLEVQTRLLAAHVLGEIDEYAAFVTR